MMTEGYDDSRNDPINAWNTTEKTDVAAVSVAAVSAVQRPNQTGAEGLGRILEGNTYLIEGQVQPNRYKQPRPDLGRRARNRHIWIQRRTPGCKCRPKLHPSIPRDGFYFLKWCMLAKITLIHSLGIVQRGWKRVRHSTYSALSRVLTPHQLRLSLQACTCAPANAESG